MTNNPDKIGNYHSGKAEDAGYKTESGNHAAGIDANDNPAVNREPNLDNQSSGNLQRSADGITGANIMTADQSIGGQGAQDGIRGTPSGTQGGQSGQGIDQGGQGADRGQSRQSGDDGQDRGGIGSQPSGNQMSTNQAGSQSGSLQADQNDGTLVHRDDTGAAAGAGASQRGTGGNQQSSDGSVTSTHGGSGTLADKLQGGPENQMGSGQGLPTGPGNQDGMSRMAGQDDGNRQSQDASQSQQSQGKDHSGHGHGGQHSGGMGGERGGPLHDVGSGQSGMTGRGGMGGRSDSQQTVDAGNLQSTEADEERLEQDLQMGARQAGMGERGDSQQSDKGQNRQGTGENRTTPDNRSDNEQADRQLGMQGQGAEPGHDVDDIGSKQSGGAGSRGGNADDQR